MQLTCPNCNQEIPSLEINVATDLAKCPVCHTIHRLSELMGTFSPAPEPEVSVTPPAGSKIDMETGRGGSVVLSIKRSGFKASHIPLLLFSIFWLGFITVWTTFAAFGSVFMALFSIPFWAVGIFMVRGLFISIFGSQKLEITGSQLIFTKNGVFKTKTVEIDQREIVAIELNSVVRNTRGYRDLANGTNMTSYGSTIVGQPTIKTNIKDYKIFDSASEAGRTWVVKFLKKVVFKK